MYICDTPCVPAQAGIRRPEPFEYLIEGNDNYALYRCGCEFKTSWKQKPVVSLSQVTVFGFGWSSWSCWTCTVSWNLLVKKHCRLYFDMESGHSPTTWTNHCAMMSPRGLLAKSVETQIDYIIFSRSFKSDLVNMGHEIQPFYLAPPSKTLSDVLVIGVSLRMWKMLRMLLNPRCFLAKNGMTSLSK